MRISDWSSDVCSSDLPTRLAWSPRRSTSWRGASLPRMQPHPRPSPLIKPMTCAPSSTATPALSSERRDYAHLHHRAEPNCKGKVLAKIGRTSFRERVGQYV